MIRGWWCEYCGHAHEYGSKRGAACIKRDMRLSGEVIDDEG